jgi:hypothetical protein
MYFFLWLFFVRFCAYSGSRRVIGGFNGLCYGALLGIFGLLIVLSSRRLDDERANAELLKKYSPVQK